MRLRLAIVGCLVVCTSVAAFAWYRGRPKQFVVNGGTNFVGVISKPNPSAYIISHDATIQGYPSGFGLEIHAFVRDVRGATLRCTLPDYPSEGGQVTLDGGPVGTTSRGFQSTKIDSATLTGCMLGVRPAPRYTLVYTTPPSAGWHALGICSVLAGPLLALAVWAAANHPLQRTGAARRGFEVVDVPERGPGR